MEKYLPDTYDEKAMKKEFEESYEILCSINKPLHEKMKKIFNKKNVDARQFVDCTGLGRYYYYHFMEEGYIPKMDALIAVSMGLNLDFPTVQSLLMSTKYSFDYTNRVHCAYMFLLTHYQGLCIEDCNKILRSLGITNEADLLGTFTSEDRKEKKIKFIVICKVTNRQRKALFYIIKMGKGAFFVILSVIL